MWLAGRFSGIFLPLTTAAVDSITWERMDSVSVNLLAIPSEVQASSLRPVVQETLLYMTRMEPGKPGAFQ
jgi:hypothetical protein